MADTFLFFAVFASVSTEVDIPGDAAACQENTKKRYLVCYFWSDVLCENVRM